MPMMRFPGTVSRPAETIVRQMEWISTIYGQPKVTNQKEENSLSVNLASGSFKIFPVIHGLSVPSSICFFNLFNKKFMYLSLLPPHSLASSLDLGRNLIN